MKRIKYTIHLLRQNGAPAVVVSSGLNFFSNGLMTRDQDDIGGRNICLDLPKWHLAVTVSDIGSD